MTDVNKEDNNGITLLMYAIHAHHIDICKLLIDSGSDLNKEDSNKNTPLFHSIYSIDYDICELLINSGCNLNTNDSPLAFSIRNCIMPIYKLLIEKGSDVNKENYDGFTPLTLSEPTKILIIYKVLL